SSAAYLRHVRQVARRTSRPCRQSHVENAAGVWPHGVARLPDSQITLITLLLRRTRGDREFEPAHSATEAKAVVQIGAMNIIGLVVSAVLTGDVAKLKILAIECVCATHTPCRCSGTDVGNGILYRAL